MVWNLVEAEGFCAGLVRDGDMGHGRGEVVVIMR
jgi:hypothetical protein